jgi:hypothetical protein
MRHTFKFPFAIQVAVRRHVRRAVEMVRPESFAQEHNYTAALAGVLQGRVYEGNHGYVEFRSTVANDKGRGASEGWTGVDFAITADIADQSKRIEKAIIFQSKKGDIAELDNRERARLVEQIKDMKALTRSPKVLEVPDRRAKMFPAVVSANKIVVGSAYTQTDLDDYFVRRVLTTLDGDTRPIFVIAVQESSFAQLRVFARIRSRE